MNAGYEDARTALRQGAGQAPKRPGGEERCRDRFEAEKKKRIAAAAKAPGGGPDGEVARRLRGDPVRARRRRGPRRIRAGGARRDRAATPSPSSAIAPGRRRCGSPMSPTPIARGPLAHGDRAFDANRPFIFDSVLGELQALGHAVRLVVHPIVDVRARTRRARRRASRRPEAELAERLRSARASSMSTCR